MMNRAAKEEAKRRAEERAGLSPEQVAELDRKEAKREALQEQVKALHIKLFREEYDHIYDDYADSKSRDKGINPMSAEYIAEVNERRAKLGVAPLGPDGMPTDTKSWDVCEEMVEKGLTENE